MQKIKEYFKILYSNKLESLEEIDKFLDSFDLPKLTQKGKLLKRIYNEQWNWNSNSLPTEKSPEPDVFTAKFF
jgi:hypothetical protein